MSDEQRAISDLPLPPPEGDMGDLAVDTAPPSELEEKESIK